MGILALSNKEDVIYALSFALKVSLPTFLPARARGSMMNANGAVVNIRWQGWYFLGRRISSLMNWG